MLIRLLEVDEYLWFSFARCHPSTAEAPLPPKSSKSLPTGKTTPTLYTLYKTVGDVLVHPLFRPSNRSNRFNKPPPLPPRGQLFPFTRLSLRRLSQSDNKLVFRPLGQIQLFRHLHAHRLRSRILRRSRIRFALLESPSSSSTTLPLSPIPNNTLSSMDGELRRPPTTGRFRSQERKLIIM